MSDLSFGVAKRRREPITFTIEGNAHEYSFTPPKQAVAFMPLMSPSSEMGSDDLAASRAMFSWLDEGLSEEDADHLEDRVRDNDDDLDFDTLGEIIEGLLTKVSGRPTTSRRDSSRSRKKTG